MSPTVAAKKPAVGAAAKALPYTGREYLDSLDDGREIWIYGERVAKITEHPAFQNCARMIARLDDVLHEDHKRGKNVLTMPTESRGSRTAISRRLLALRNKWRVATRSPSGHVSHMVGSAVRPTIKRHSWERLAPMPSFMRHSRRNARRCIA